MAATERSNQARSDWSVAVAVIIVGLVVFGANARIASTLPALTSPRAPYITQLASLLQRYDVSIAALEQLLTQRDLNPGLVGSTQWLEQDAGVSQELQTEYRLAAALTPPGGNSELHACVVDGLRLTASGAMMLHDGFLTGGHGAYYLGSHGNWDLNLGRRQIERCRVSLVKSGAVASSRVRLVDVRVTLADAQPASLRRHRYSTILQSVHGEANPYPNRAARSAT